ncbi:para-aminobenzoate synthetase component 1 [bacterium A37T11]|nr:para-aminobenzoate synthetase component 1 [bacterium A37T11]
MGIFRHQPSDIGLFIKKSLKWASSYDSLCYLDSNGYHDPFGQVNKLIAVGEKVAFNCTGNQTFSRLQDFLDQHPGHWVPGFLSYDLKNETEDLETRHPDRLHFPEAYFFLPEHLLLFDDKEVCIRTEADPHTLIATIEGCSSADGDITFAGEIKQRMDRNEYMKAFNSLQEHIHRGDIYEVNLCQEFYGEQVQIDPLSVYTKLNTISPTPFSCYFKYRDRYILSASPERFLIKQGQQLIAQPIKGTAPRSPDPQEDSLLSKKLRTNGKEIAENMMIVDLVRNDLTRSAAPGTVNTSDLLEVRSYRQVHQLVSTVLCELRAGVKPAEAIRNTFPAGSMTGAPKISAMQLIDRYENSRRGIYSGAIGYFGPEGDFDFNVVIRTILYNATSGYLSFHTGGAITAQAKGEEEYNECFIKAKAILETLSCKCVT